MHEIDQALDRLITKLRENETLGVKDCVIATADLRHALEELERANVIAELDPE